mmetsp:Transcript_40539/g.63297  ORF Transcript_40539/g.63297 Transcript_40539/m.63297 type:complete len:872 (-) Transcript_40539:351-2966(-)
MTMVPVVNNRAQLMIRNKTSYRWVLTMIIGVGVAASAKFLMFAIDLLSDLRNDKLQEFYDTERSIWDSYVFFVSANACLVFVGSILTVYMEPATVADGVAEIKAFINGTHVKHFLKLRTILVKIAGTILSVSSGLVSGAESPMIHIGAGIASGVTRGDKLKNLCIEFSPEVLGLFHNDRDRRQFVSAGAGAGIAAAFGAPIGGVLFVLEETAGHWSPELVWRIFTATLITTLALALMKAEGNNGDISLAGILSFGTTNSIGRLKGGNILADRSVAAPIFWWEVVFFIWVGVIGGVIGGTFNKALSFIARHRPKRSILKVLEVLVVSVLTSSAIFYLAYFRDDCRNNGLWTCRDADNWGEWCSGPQDNSTCNGPRASCTNASLWTCDGGLYNGQSCRSTGCEEFGGICVPSVIPDVDAGLRLACEKGQYDELGTILLGSREQAIIRLVNQAWPAEPYRMSSMALAAIVLCVLMLLTFGIHIPTGIFMPCALIGALVGRVVGEAVEHHVDDRVYPGNYAFAGAAAVLGGVQRVTISLVIIMVEGTANVHSLLPIVVTAATANFVGNFFGREGVYDILMRRKQLRFLPHNHDWMMQLCSAGDVMARPVVCLRVVERIGCIVDVLRGCEHNGFPVLSLGGGSRQEEAEAGAASPGGRFEGLILRQHLRNILATRFVQNAGFGRSLWQRMTADNARDVELDGDLELYNQMETRRRIGSHVCHSIKEWEWALFSTEDRRKFINLGAYMNSACFTVSETTPLSRAYDLFQQMSLRHLPVLDSHSRVVGMLARENLTKEMLHKAIATYYHPEEVHRQPQEKRTPRMRAQEQLQRQQRRVGLLVQGTEDAGGGRNRRSALYTGGPVKSWQARLAPHLRTT